MQRSWSTSPVASLDLLLAAEPDAGRRAGLERALRLMIRDGRLPPGARLPSSRALATDLGVARGTVSEAYAQLVAEGYLLAHQGSGTVVAAQAGVALAAPVDAPAASEARFDFHPGLPDVSSFPRAAWAAAARRVLREAPDDAFGYGDSRGRLELRRALAVYLGRARGVLTSPERIVVCTGYHQGLGLLCHALHARGARAIAIENPTVPEYRTIVEQSGLEVVAVGVDEGGLRVEDVVGRSADAVVVTPAHQSPLGSTLRASRRSALVRWAREQGAVVVEDDYDGEFRYDRQPIGALQGLAPDQVVYAGTASKSLAPGLRLAWLALPAAMLEPVVEAKRLADRHSPVLDQLTLADLLASGAFDRHVRRQRLAYRRRRDRLVSELAERAPSIQPIGVAAGLHVVLPLPSDGPSEAEVIAAAAERSIGLFGLDRFWHGPGERLAGLVVGYAAPPRHLFPSAVRALADTLAMLER